LESPRDRKDFFPFAIHVINAAIIAFSFELVKDDFVPFDLIKTFSDKVNFLAVLFVWGFLISGWLGYTKSVSDKPHKEGLVGNLRFVTELVISFFMLYLFILAQKNEFVTNFGSAFVWIIPIIFGLFII
jgi:succinate dehydrogenase hydrophobic anchor subunit